MDAETPALTQAPTPRQRLRAVLSRPAVLIAVASLLLLGWQWLETRSRLSDLQHELAQRLLEGQTIAGEARSAARQNAENLQALTAKVGALETRLAEAQSQQLALEAMYQELSKTRDERLLAEIEQAVAIAAQQLQLAGNVEAALIALQSADARLARAGQAQFLPVRKLLNRDMDRLKALPMADIAGIALKLEGTVAAIDTLPLAFEQRGRPAETAAAAKKPANWWQALGLDLWAEIRALVRIERVDAADPALLSPNQAFFLRENLKLRLINARLALLARDGRSFREDLRQARDWLERYFDRHAKPVQSAVANLNALAATDLTLELPSLNETLTALRSGKLVAGRGGGAAR